ncbi:DUF5719 family protein [Actinotalea sp. AC32]|nr:DUF5719 family protein [Actinotalea sp. AC32]
MSDETPPTTAPAQDASGTPGEVQSFRPRVGAARRVARAAARAGAALLVLGVAAGVAVLDESVDRPATVEAGADTVSVPPAAVRLVCPGGVRVPTEPVPGEDVSYDAQFDPSPEDAVERLVAVLDGAGDAGVGPLGGSATGLDVAEDAGEATLEDVDGGSVLEVVPEDVVVAAGVVTASVGSGDLRGITAAGCVRPAAEQWLVGGGTSVGSSARLVLQNPGRTAASVEVDLWGPAGPVELAGAPEFLVPAGSERVVLLEGVAADQRRVVVRVTASGGLVGAYVQDSELRGLVPAGVDHVVPGAAPSTRQVVPGIDVPATEVEGADPALLRLLAPGTGTTARISLVGPEGVVQLPGAEEVRLEAGTVLDVPLGGLAEGGYTAVVEADEPVVAAAMVTRGRSVGRTDGVRTDPVDRAWAASVRPGGTSAVALPSDVPGRLVLGVVEGDGPRTVEVGVRLLSTGGGVVAEGTVTLTEGRSTTVGRAELLELLTGEEATADDVERVAGVVVSTDDERLAWASVLTAPLPTGDVVSVTVPTPALESRTEVAVALR